MSQAYRIAKWEETYETNESRKLKRLTWISLPVTFGSNGYQSLVEEFDDDAPAVYGAWIALVKLASQCPTRGVLATSRGEPYSTKRIARLTYMPVKCFEMLIPWASSESVGWLVLGESRHDSGTTPGDHREITGGESGDCREDGGGLPGGRREKTTPTLHYTTLPYITEPDWTGLDSAPATSVEVSPSDGEENKKKLSEIATQITKSVVPSQSKPLTQRNRELALKAAMLTWCHGFAPVVELALDRLDEMHRSQKPPERPWGYFKSELIRRAREAGLDFDGQWNELSIPESLLKPRDGPTRPPNREEVAHAD